MQNVKTLYYAAALSVFFVVAGGCAKSHAPEKNRSVPVNRDIIEGVDKKGNSHNLIRKYEDKLFEQNASISRLENDNASLSDEIIDLKRTNAKCKALLDLQDRVLQLLDDRNNTVRTMLTEEAAKLNLPVNYTGGERIRYSFNESDLFEPDSTAISTTGRNMITEIFNVSKNKKLKALVIENSPCRPGNESGSPGILPSECTLSVMRAAVVTEFLSTRMNQANGPVSFATFISASPDPANPAIDNIHERRMEIVLELAQ